MTDDSPRTRKNSTAVRVYCLPKELDAIKDRAQQAGHSVSTYLRLLGLGHEPRSVYDLDQVDRLAKVNADQARLGNLLKMWLADDDRLKRFDEAQMRATILIRSLRCPPGAASLLASILDVESKAASRRFPENP